jgi:hypothetical protein
MGVVGGALPLESPQFVLNAADTFGKLREAVGPGVQIATDFHGRTSPAVPRRPIQAIIIMISPHLTSPHLISYGARARSHCRSRSRGTQLLRESGKVDRGGHSATPRPNPY